MVTVVKEKVTSMMTMVAVTNDDGGDDGGDDDECEARWGGNNWKVPEAEGARSVNPPTLLLAPYLPCYLVTATGSLATLLLLLLPS